LALYQAKARKEAVKEILWGLIGIAFVVLLIALSDQPWWKSLYNPLFVIGVVIAGFNLWSFLRAKDLTAKHVAEHTQAFKFAEWIRANETSASYTKGLAGLLIVVGCAQVVFGGKESIEAAGLVKPAVWRGEVWRLLTCATLHVNFMHIWMNIMALWGEGRLMETLAHRAHLPVVFLCSALGGSICSLLLLPNTTSVGASGGLMGLIGYQLVLARRRKGRLPANFYRSVMTGILLIGALGVIGFAFIDNAAHGGGLLAGVACGHYLIGEKSEELPLIPGIQVTWLSYLSLVIIGMVGILSIIVMI
jgi:membrane associated rhomboid family serine protease